MTPTAILLPGRLCFFTRCVHSFIHLGTNNVSARFFTFGVSLIFLVGS